MKYRYAYQNDDAHNHKLKIIADGEVIASGLQLNQASRITNELNQMAIENESNKLAAKRYEAVRLLSVLDFQHMINQNLITGKPFDELLDEDIRYNMRGM